MAGESPDRSKQRESSAQPTSGSADPVPEARSEVRDPRLSLTGDSGAPGASEDSGASERCGGVDTATRVLSVRDLAADGGGVGGGRGAQASEKGQGGRDAGTAGKPGRAAQPERTDGAKDDAEAADGRPEDAGEAEKAGEAEAAAKSGRAEAGNRKAGEAEEGAAAGKAGEVSRDSDSDSDDEDDAPGEVRLREADPEDTEDAEDAEESPAGPKADGADGTKDAEDVAEADDAERDGTARDTAPAAADADAEDADAEAADDAPKSGPATEPRSKTPRGDGDPQGPADDRKPDGKPPVDQPTTMLKVGGAAKPRVDQPTTMLKLGGDRKQDKGNKGNEGNKEGKEKQDAHVPESDAERTSKFVALRPLDVPETRKPKPAKPAAPAGETTALPKAPADATTAVPQVGPERTTQQPLPPKPPLDLLAELTNTPPPPETPLRTAVRRVKIWTPLVVLLVIVFAVVQAVRPLPAPTLALTVKDTHTFDGDQVKLPWPSEGQGWMDVDGIGTMDHFGEQKPVAIGSVAKTMTAYIILRDHPLKPGQEGPKIEVDPTAEKEGGYDQQNESTLNTVKAGDFLTEKQALSAVMIPSANNIARLLARWDAGSEESFVKKMNATAKELGMANTTYTDPSGLKETTVSTAEDQVKLGNAAMRIPAMVAITSAASWQDPSGRTWSNYNELPYTIGAIGIKTGSTTKAGGNLLFAARKKVGDQTVTIVGAILGQHKPSILDTVNAVSRTALLAARDVPTSAKILKKGDVVGYVDDQLGGHTPIVVTKDVTAVGWAGLKVRLSVVAKDVPSIGKAGDEVGTLTVGDGADGAVQVPVALQKDLAEPGLTDKLTRIG